MVFSKPVVVKHTEVITSCVVSLKDFKIWKASAASLGFPKALLLFQTMVSLVEFQNPVLSF